MKRAVAASAIAAMCLLTAARCGPYSTPADQPPPATDDIPAFSPNSDGVISYTWNSDDNTWDSADLPAP